MLKRLFIIIILLCVPLSSMAMKAMDDKTMEDISGQAGVSMYVDITMNIHIGTLAWGDADGLAPGPYNPWTVQAKGGYVGATNLVIAGLFVAPRAFAASNTAYFWPDTGIINIVNGKPYYQVNPGSGNQ